MRAALQGFLTNRSGAVAVILAVALPAVIGGVAATVEYGNVIKRRSELQIAADTAALTATRELSLAAATDERIQSVARHSATASLQARGGPVKVNVTPQVLAQRDGVAVHIQEEVASVLGRVLTLPSMDVQVRATAKRVGRYPICML